MTRRYFDSHRILNQQRKKYTQKKKNFVHIEVYEFKYECDGLKLQANSISVVLFYRTSCFHQDEI